MIAPKTKYVFGDLTEMLPMLNGLNDSDPDSKRSNFL